MGKFLCVFYVLKISHINIKTLENNFDDLLYDNLLKFLKIIENTLKNRQAFEHSKGESTSISNVKLHFLILFQNFN